MQNLKNITKTPFVTAVLVAAGNSTRMGAKCSKQFIELLGVPVIIHTISAFEQADCIDEIVIVCREEDRDVLRGMIADNHFNKVSQIVNGGETRQQSVFCGIRAACEKADYFAVHDGARALILPTSIQKTVQDAFTHQASAAGIPVKDTIKIVDADGMIQSTPNRALLWAVQTPQVFERQLYLSAINKALEEKADYTDDCQLIESMGHPVHLCRGEYDNIKITTMDDIALAEHILEYRKREEQE